MNAFTFSFSTRESYLAWRADWKLRYRQLAACIRVWKEWQRDGCKGYRFFSGKHLATQAEEDRWHLVCVFTSAFRNGVHEAAKWSFNNRWGYKPNLSTYARWMMAERAAAKAEAARQRKALVA